MALNSYFTNYSYTAEQNLLNDLSVEMIQMFGIEVAYLHRSHINIDPLFIEDPLSRFENVHYVEMYMKDFYGYGNMSDMFSKFSIATNDKLMLSVMRSRFAEEFPSQTRPFEGDLIYIPMTKALFEIKYVEHEDNFYQNGNLLYYDLELERFTYSNEDFETGDAEIDAIETKFSFATDSYEIVDEDGEVIQSENGVNIVAETATTTVPAALDSLLVQNEFFKIQSQEIIDFSETNPFGIR